MLIVYTRNNNFEFVQIRRPVVLKLEFKIFFFHYLCRLLSKYKTTTKDDYALLKITTTQQEANVINCYKTTIKFIFLKRNVEIEISKFQ